MTGKQNLENEIKKILFDSNIVSNLKFHGSLATELDTYQITYKMHPEINERKFNKKSKILLGKIEKIIITNFPQIEYSCNYNKSHYTYEIKISKLPYEDSVNDTTILLLNKVKNIISSYSKFEK